MQSEEKQTCVRCKTQKPLNSFRKSEDNPKILRQCKECRESKKKELSYCKTDDFDDMSYLAYLKNIYKKNKNRNTQMLIDQHLERIKKK